MKVNTIKGINGEAIENNRENLLDYKDVSAAINQFQR